VFGNRNFKNQLHITAASKNAQLIRCGERPSSIGDYTTINNPPRGKPIKKRRKFLDKVHMDIVFGDCMALGGFRYALILVDVATRYTWLYGLTSLSSTDIINALSSFQSAMDGRMPRKFHTDFDKKLMGGKALRWIHANKSKVIAAPARRQSSNGLVERTWQTIVRMARSYITEKQVGREYWYWAIKRASEMLNQVPGRMGRKLTSPFELVYGVKPDARTWFELFSVGFFPVESKAGEAASASQAQTLDGIAVGRDEQSNTIIFYNPITKKYYSPPVFKLEQSQLPVMLYPKHIRFDGGFVCGPLRNRTDPVAEPFPPGTRISVTVDDKPMRGTIQNVPLPFSNFLPSSTIVAPVDGDSAPSTYTILLDDGTTIERKFEDLLDPTESSEPAASDAVNPFAGLPSFLSEGSKITVDHNGAFHKGFIHHSPTLGFHVAVKRNLRSNKVDFTVPLPSFRQNWSSLVGDNVILPGHSTVSSFLRPNTTNNAPSANLVSAKNLLQPCPPSLLKALHPSNPDRDVWLKSYNEEKGGLIDLNVYDTINKKTYLQLRRSGKIGKALPSMCVLVIKPDKDGKPHRAKSRIVVLGNHEDRYYSKSQRYAPVLKYTSLRLLCSKAVEAKRVLQQGDCKNAFCHAKLPPEELTVVMPPVGDPAHGKDEYWLLNKTLYGLRRSPHHWYNMFCTALKELGLEQSVHDPCLFSGNLASDTAPTAKSKLHVGIYVDDFVFYSEDPAIEKAFQEQLKQKVVVDFMGDVDYFLGTAFTWKHLPGGHLSVHLCQSAFTEFTAHRFAIDRYNRTPHMTPYRSGLPIDSIPPPDPKDPDLKRRTKVYQSIVGCINWLATCTRPDVSPVVSFLASYSTAPSHQHYKSALHALKYLYSTADYGICFHSDASNTIQAFNHFPHYHDKEAYSDASPPPSPADCYNLTAFSDACWGGQVGNSVPDGTPLELFKLRSMSGFLICRTGGPLAWSANRQKQTALSSCVAEIMATNECTTELDSILLRAQDLDMPDAFRRVTIYNDNKAAVDWAASCTNKGTKHINLRENYVRERHQSGVTKVTHIPGVINSSDLFTKELKDAAHFRRCRDSFMVSKSVFDRHGCIMPSHHITKNDLPYYSIRSKTTLEASRPAEPRRPSAGARLAPPTRAKRSPLSVQRASSGADMSRRYPIIRGAVTPDRGVLTRGMPKFGMSTWPDSGLLGRSL
jgi:hypothetical protein